MNQLIEIDQRAVFEDVHLSTNYGGAKMAQDGSLFEHVRTDEYNDEILSRYWSESQAAVDVAFRRIKASSVDANGRYTLVLNVGSNFDTENVVGIERALHSYFVKSIVSRWYALTNKEESVGVSVEASVYLKSAQTMAFQKKRPQRDL